MSFVSFLFWTADEKVGSVGTCAIIADVSSSPRTATDRQVRSRRQSWPPIFAKLDRQNPPISPGTCKSS
jgi:hypothetical protein